MEKILWILNVVFNKKNFIFMLLISIIIFLINTNAYTQKSAIVVIKNCKRGNSGTGFVTKDGIYTAFHLVKKSDTVDVYYHNGDYTKAFIISADTLNDIALLKPLNPIETKILEFANDTLKELDNVYTIGHPTMIKFMYYKGYVHKNQNNDYIVSFDIAGGISGAPLLGEDGKIYGIIYSLSPIFQICFARRMIGY